MQLQDNEVEPSTGTRELERVQGELEQARVALEDMDHRLGEHAVENNDLHQRLASEIRQRETAEWQLQQLKQAASAVAPDIGPGLREQLSTALEELHVMAEELQLAQEALGQPTGLD